MHNNIDELIKMLNECCHSIESLAYNYDGSLIEELDPHVVDSTGCAEDGLIKVRNARALIVKIKQEEDHAN